MGVLLRQNPAYHTILCLLFKKRGWDKSPSLSIIFGLSSKTQWLSGLYYADFISFTALLNCAEVGRRNRILTNYRFLSHSLLNNCTVPFNRNSVGQSIIHFHLFCVLQDLLNLLNQVQHLTELLCLHQSHLFLVKLVLLEHQVLLVLLVLASLVLV